MHSLIGDRFLKKFLGGILLRRSLKPADSMGAEPDEREGLMIKSNNSEKRDEQGEAAPEQIEKVQEIANNLNGRIELDRSLGAARPPQESGHPREEEFR